MVLKGSFDSQRNAFGKYTARIRVIVSVHWRQVIIVDKMRKENSHFFHPEREFEKKTATRSTKDLCKKETDCSKFVLSSNDVTS